MRFSVYDNETAEFVQEVVMSCHAVSRHSKAGFEVACVGDKTVETDVITLFGHSAVDNEAESDERTGKAITVSKAFVTTAGIESGQNPFEDNPPVSGQNRR